jgi:hypothetical protein
MIPRHISHQFLMLVLIAGLLRPGVSFSGEAEDTGCPALSPNFVDIGTTKFWASVKNRDVYLFPLPALVTKNFPGIESKVVTAVNCTSILHSQKTRVLMIDRDVSSDPEAWTPINNEETIFEVVQFSVTNDSLNNPQLNLNVNYKRVGDSSNQYLLYGCSRSVDMGIDNEVFSNQLIFQINSCLKKY